MEGKILSGKNALVTGGNRGVGKQIVRKFAQSGANVIFNSSSPNPAAEEFAKEIAKEFSVECHYVTCNIADEKEIDNMCNIAKEKFKRIDILVNNAGKAAFGAVDNIPLDDWNECIKINLTAPFLFCQKLIPGMKENKWGRVINTTSGTTQKVMPNLSAYICAKNGVNSLTKVLAKEVGDFGITVNCIVPS